SAFESWLGEAPGPGATVMIPKGVTVVLDQDTPPLGNLIVHGTLVFGDVDVTVTAENVLVFGTLRAGSEDAPHQYRAEIVLTGDASGADIVLADW
ncbi:G8 domain-containing protein, partial [Limnospira sp. PMC 1280.21]